MSEQSNTQNTSEAPRTRTRSTARIEHSAVLAMWAQAHPKDPSGKGFRRVLRANRDADRAYKAHAKNAPWPAHQRAVLRKLFENDAAFLAALDGKRARKPRKAKGAQS